MQNAELEGLSSCHEQKRFISNLSKMEKGEVGNKVLAPIYLGLSVINRQDQRNCGYNEKSSSLSITHPAILYPPPHPIATLSIPPTPAMAAAIKALNAKIRSNPVSDYLCSTRKPASPVSPFPLRARNKLTRCMPTRQISGARPPISASPSQPSWTRRRILRCMSPHHHTPPSVPPLLLLPEHSPPFPILQNTPTPLPPSSLPPKKTEANHFPRSPKQHLGPHDRGADALLGHLHALRPGRDAQEPAAVRVPLYQFRVPVDAGVSVHEVLEVSWLFFFLGCLLGEGGGGSGGGVEGKEEKGGKMEDVWNACFGIGACLGRMWA